MECSRFVSIELIPEQRTCLISPSFDLLFDLNTENISGELHFQHKMNEAEVIKTEYFACV